MGEDGAGRRGLSRGALLKTAAAAGSGLLLAGRAGAAPTTPTSSRRRAAAAGDLAGMNVLVFLTDQQRAIQHFPPGWVRRNMPGLSRLQRYGLTFENAFTNTCMCSPARSTLMSGFFPAQHGVKYTLESDMPASQYPQVELDTHFKNPATVAAAAGYTPVYKGKFHCNKPANGSTWVPLDVNRYGFTRWDPPDAGANQDVPEEGGGAAALLHVRLAGEPARRAVLPPVVRRRGVRRLVAAGRARAARDRRRGAVDEADGAGPVPAAVQRLRADHQPADDGRVRQLLRQPDEGVGRLPREDPRHPRREAPAREHPRHRDGRPW